MFFILKFNYSRINHLMIIPKDYSCSFRVSKSMIKIFKFIYFFSSFLIIYALMINWPQQLIHQSKAIVKN